MKSLRRSVAVPAVAGVALLLSGCATGTVQTAYGEMPAYCMDNNAATGALIGTLAGAALGAAIGGGRGAAIGAGLGAMTGGVAGANADAQCRQIAHQRVVEMALAAQAQAAAQRRPISRVAYESFEYVAPSTGVRHRVTPLNSYTNPATRQPCFSTSEVTFGPDGKWSAPLQGRLCRGVDGKIHEA